MSNPLTPERVKELLVQVERHKAVTDSGGDARPVPVEWPILLALLTFYAERSAVCWWVKVG